MPLETFQDKLGYRFKDQRLMLRSLTHPSYANERGIEDNQTLEFLGDAVVDLAASVMLLEAHPNADEGELSRRRAVMVNEKALAEVGRLLDLASVIRLGKSELRSAGTDKPSVLADTVEAIVGAIYQEAGYTVALEVVRKHLMVSGDAEAGQGDPKSRLQELVQKKHGQLPVYEVISETGPHHERIYQVCVRIQGVVQGRGMGRSKKEAERQAAAEALGAIQNA